jgi:hypothetical protein
MRVLKDHGGLYNWLEVRGQTEVFSYQYYPSILILIQYYLSFYTKRILSILNKI